MSTAPPTRHEPADDRAAAKPATRHEFLDARSGKPQTRHEPVEVTGVARPRRLRLQMPPAIDERYDYERDLSSGAQADVALLRERATGREMAIKIYRLQASPSDLSAIESLRGASPEHVVPFTLEQDEDQVWEVQEYFPLGSLDDLVTRRGGGAQDPGFVRAVVGEVALALDHIHGRQITHRDLKPQNVLIRADDPLDCVLADFGLARVNVLSHAIGSIAGTYPYTSPEGTFGRANKPNDWWGLGVITHQLLTGQHLFAVPGGEGFLSETRVRQAFFEQSWSYDEVTDPRWRLLLDGLLAEAKDRWAFAQVDQWLRGGSPAVARRTPRAETTASSGRRQRTTYHFGRADHDTPQSLARAIRTNFDDACDLLAGARAADLGSWLHGTEVGTDADDLLSSVRTANADPGRAAVELQFLLDADTEPVFRGRPLSPAGLADAAQQAKTGDAAAARWIGQIRELSLLSLGDRYYEQSGWALAEDLLRTWWTRLDVLIASAPWKSAAARPFVDSSQPAFEGLLLGAAIAPAAQAEILREARARLADLPTDAPEAFRRIDLPQHPNTAGVADAVLVLRTASGWLGQRREEEAQRARQQELEREQEAKRVEAARQAERTRRWSRRRRTDKIIIGWALILCLTVLAPWLLGRYVLRGELFRPEVGWVDANARDPGVYFLSDWTAGCVVILFGAAVLLVLRPWGGRLVGLILAAVLVGGSIVGLMPYSERTWTMQETTLVARMRSTAFPFERRFVTCGRASKPFGASETTTGQPEVVYSLFAGQIPGTTVDGCDRLSFYEGWRLVRTIDLKKGQRISRHGKPTITVSKGKVADTTFTVRLTNGKKLKYKLPKLIKG